MFGLTAEQLGVVLLAAALAITNLFAKREGQKAVSQQPRTVADPINYLEVNAAVINPAVAAEMVHAVRENTQAMKEFTDVVDGLADKMDDLKIEIIRGNRK